MTINLRFCEHDSGEWTQASLDGPLDEQLISLLISGLAGRPWVETQILFRDEWETLEEGSTILADVLEERT